MDDQPDPAAPKGSAEESCDAPHVSELRSRQKAYRRAEQAYKTAQRLSQRLKQTAGRLTTSEWITAIFTAVIAGATIWNVVVVQSQLAEMRFARKSGDRSTAEQIAILQQQTAALKKQAAALETDALIRRDQMLPKMKLDFVIQLDTKTDKSPGWLVTPRWVNSGQTDALDWQGWDGLKAFSGEPSDKEFAEPQPNAMVSGTLAATGVVFQATQPIPDSVVRSVLTDPKAIIVAYGQIQWRDVFPDTPIHYRSWCVRLTPIEHAESIHWQLPASFRSSCNRSGDK